MDDHQDGDFAQIDTQLGGNLPESAPPADGLSADDLRLDGLRSLSASEMQPLDVPGEVLSETQTRFVQRDAERQQQLGRVPLGRFAKPLEVGAAVAFLCSQEAGFITGQELLVDGGAGN